MKKTIPRKLLTLVKTLIATLVLACFTSRATVAPIQLFNTGVNGSGGLLPNSTVDLHYSVIAAPSPYNTAYTGNGNDVQFMPWLQDGPSSRWIGVTDFMGEWRPAGTYVFRTTFDLSGKIPSSASLSLHIASDNTCNVYLNGAYTGIATPFSGFNSFSSYNVTTGFLNGINTLDFQVSEPGSTPSGLRVEMTGFATLVPEPAVATLAGLGGLLLRASRRKRR